MGSPVVKVVPSAPTTPGRCPTVRRLPLGRRLRPRSWQRRRRPCWPNRPNPFNSTTQITYHLASPRPVRLVIYNLLGQVVTVLADAYQEMGAYQVAWEGRDVSGARVVSGVYLYRLQAGSFDQVRKMTILQ